MLLMVTLIGSVSSNLVQTNLKVVQNIEARAAARNAARSALQEAIVYGHLLDGVPFVTGCGSQAVKCFDLTGDGIVDDIKVEISAAKLLTARVVKNSELKKSDSGFPTTEDEDCYDNDSAFSKCADTVWEVSAVATDNVTNAQLTVAQGLSLRVRRTKIDEIIDDLE